MTPARANRRCIWPLFAGRRAWCRDNALLLGQVATDAHSNEITAIPKLLELLALKGTVVSIDAPWALAKWGTQREIAQQILDAKANYVLALKGNQTTLCAQVEQFFRDAPRPQRLRSPGGSAAAHAGATVGQRARPLGDTRRVLRERSRVAHRSQVAGAEERNLRLFDAADRRAGDDRTPLLPE